MAVDDGNYPSQRTWQHEEGEHIVCFLTKGSTVFGNVPWAECARIAEAICMLNSQWRWDHKPAGSLHGAPDAWDGAIIYALNETLMS